MTESMMNILLFLLQVARKSSHEEINPIFQGAIGSRFCAASERFDPLFQSSFPTGGVNAHVAV